MHEERQQLSDKQRDPSATRTVSQYIVTPIVGFYRSAENTEASPWKEPDPSRWVRQPLEEERCQRGQARQVGEDHRDPVHVYRYIGDLHEGQRAFSYRRQALTPVRLDDAVLWLYDNGVGFLSLDVTVPTKSVEPWRIELLDAPKGELQLAEVERMRVGRDGNLSVTVVSGADGDGANNPRRVTVSLPADRLPFDLGRKRPFKLLSDLSFDRKGTDRQTVRISWVGDRLRPKNVVAIEVEARPTHDSLADLNHSLMSFAKHGGIPILEVPDAGHPNPRANRFLIRDRALELLADLGDVEMLIDDVVPMFCALRFEASEGQWRPLVDRLVRGLSSVSADRAIEASFEEVSPEFHWGFRRGFVALIGFEGPEDHNRYVRTQLMRGERDRYLAAYIGTIFQLVTISVMQGRLATIDLLRLDDTLKSQNAHRPQDAHRPLQALDEARRLHLDLMSRTDLSRMAHSPLMSQFVRRVRAAQRLDSLSSSVTDMVTQIGNYLDNYYARAADRRERLDTERWNFFGWVISAIAVPLTFWGALLGINIRETNDKAGLFSLFTEFGYGPLWAWILGTMLFSVSIVISRIIHYHRRRRAIEAAYQL